jgi:hypothetical protein
MTDELDVSRELYIGWLQWYNAAGIEELETNKALSQKPQRSAQTREALSCVIGTEVRPKTETVAI